jgi:hypothetical protein
MSGDVHVRFRERPGGRFPWATRLVIVCARGVEPPMRVLRSVLERLGLSLNEAKTRVVDAREQSFDFLGFSFRLRRSRHSGKRYPHVEPSKRSVQRIKDRAKQLTPRRRTPVPMPHIIGELNRTLRGWRNYSPPQLHSGTVQGEDARGRAGTYSSASAPQAPQPGAGVPALSRPESTCPLWTLQAGDDGTLAHGACPGVKSIGTCTGKPYARFDERGLATVATDGLLRHRQTKGAETDRPSLRSRDTCPLLYPLTPFNSPIFPPHLV